MRKIAIYLLCIFMLPPVATMTAQTGYNYSKLQREKLNRGVVAIRENPSEVIVSWRYLSSDPIQTGFNVYKDGKKLTDTPVTVSTLFRDKNNSQKAAVYEVRPVIKGKRHITLTVHTHCRKMRLPAIWKFPCKNRQTESHRRARLILTALMTPLSEM